MVQVDTASKDHGDDDLLTESNNIIRDIQRLPQVPRWSFGGGEVHLRDLVNRCQLVLVCCLVQSPVNLGHAWW